MGKQQEEGQYFVIPGYPLYEIDQLANVRRIYKTKRVLLVPVLKKGVYVVRLQSPDGSRKEERLHKLMQRTFMPDPKPNQVLYHKSFNKRDNCLANLAYIDRVLLGQMTGAKSRRRPVAKIDQHGEVVEIYSSAREAARQNFMSYQTVMDRCNGKVKSLYALDGHRYQWDDDLEYGSDEFSQERRKRRPTKKIRLVRRCARAQEWQCHSSDTKKLSARWNFLFRTNITNYKSKRIFGLNHRKGGFTNDHT